MNWLSDPKKPWNRNGRQQMVFVVTSTFLEFAGALLIWLALYEWDGTRAELDLGDRITGLIGTGVFLAGSIGSALIFLVGAMRRTRHILSRFGVRPRRRDDVLMLPWIASIASFTFGTALIIAVNNRPDYFRDEIIGLLATLLVAFAASSRAIEVFTELPTDEEE